MKNQAHLTLAALLMLGGTFVSSQAEEAQSSWQKWKKPVIATTMVVGGIVGWLLLDCYLNGQFNSKLDTTTNDLVAGRSNHFFEDNGQLRKHPFISTQDYQLYENAHFEDMWAPLSEAKENIINLVRDSFAARRIITPSNISYALRSFNVNLLSHQIGSKLCFLASLIGGYWLMNSEVDPETETTKTIQS